MTRNMRMFFFYDSSAATIVYCFHNIYSRPDVLARVRAEHDEVFGADVASAPAKIVENPRVAPPVPAGGLRQGSADLVLKDAEGNLFPTEGIAITMLHWVIGRNPRYWVKPDEFIPDRWLQLVMVEARAVLACIIREFDIRDSFAEIDGKRKLDTSGLGGQRVFMVEAGAAHPTDGYPCRVSLSGYKA
uniref:Sterigmatocystin biosynthesis p450 monooxygenase n=1 Tax=Colletotrichum fructicola (strain Nara gc5) TaxID=1213859 RepID=L2GAN4_COLFN